jgi:hypothetical protein
MRLYTSAARRRSDQNKGKQYQIGNQTAALQGLEKAHKLGDKRIHFVRRPNDQPYP